jgi:hypothetical protein
MATFEKTSPDDQQKRINAGIVVVVIAAASAILASIAWSIPMGMPGYLVGIIWFAIMLLLERAILQQMDAVAAGKLVQKYLKGDFKVDTKERGVGVGWLLLRFIMIIFICYFNSEMVRVVMFKPEIVAEIKVRQHAETAKIADSISAVRKSIKRKNFQADSTSTSAEKDLIALIDRYNGQITAISDSIAYLSAKLPHEVKGPGGISGKSGDGPVAKAIRQSIEMFQNQKAALVAERDSAKIGSAQANALAFARKQAVEDKLQTEAEVKELDKREQQLIDQVMDRPVNGLAFMLSVLNDISGRNMLIWAVFFMFFFIEAIPVLLKFFSKIDSFVYLRAMDQLEMMKDHNQRAANIVQQLRAIERQSVLQN